MIILMLMTKMKQKEFERNFSKQKSVISSTDGNTLEDLLINLKPYELFNLELKQYTHSSINCVRRNDAIQQILNDRKLHIEVLLQTLEIKKFDVNNSDVIFIIRYNDINTKEHVDVKIETDNKFSEISVGGKLTNDPVYDIFKFLTMTIKQVQEATV